MRAAAVLNRLLGFAGTIIDQVSFTDAAIVITVRLRSKVLICHAGAPAEPAMTRPATGEAMSTSAGTAC